MLNLNLAVIQQLSANLYAFREIIIAGYENPEQFETWLKYYQPEVLKICQTVSLAIFQTLTKSSYTNAAASFAALIHILKLPPVQAKKLLTNFLLRHPGMIGLVHKFSNDAIEITKSYLRCQQFLMQPRELHNIIQNWLIAHNDINNQSPSIYQNFYKSIFGAQAKELNNKIHAYPTTHYIINELMQADKRLSEIRSKAINQIEQLSKYIADEKLQLAFILWQVENQGIANQLPAAWQGPYKNYLKTCTDYILLFTKNTSATELQFNNMLSAASQKLASYQMYLKQHYPVAAAEIQQNNTSKNTSGECKPKKHGGVLGVYDEMIKKSSQKRDLSINNAETPIMATTKRMI